MLSLVCTILTYVVAVAFILIVIATGIAVLLLIADWDVILSNKKRSEVK